MVGLGRVSTLSVPCRRSGVVGTTISPSSGWSMRSSMPRSCMCGSFMTSGALRTGAQGHLHFAEGARPLLDQRVGFVHMRDPGGIGRKAGIVLQLLTSHCLQQI